MLNDLDGDGRTGAEESADAIGSMVESVKQHLAVKVALAEAVFSVTSPSVYAFITVEDDAGANATVLPIHRPVDSSTVSLPVDRFDVSTTAEIVDLDVSDSIIYTPNDGARSAWSTTTDDQSEWLPQTNIQLNVQTGEGRDHVTYRGIKNGKSYTGYASAPSERGLTPQQIVDRRYGGDFSEFGLVAPRPVYAGSGVEGKQTARGLEQHFFEKDVQDLGRENVANKQNPVGGNDRNRENYLESAKKELEKLK